VDDLDQESPRQQLYQGEMEEAEECQSSYSYRMMDAQDALKLR
jgi:hypothetical protein